MCCRTVSRMDISIPDWLFPEDRSLTDTSPTDTSLTGQFPDWTLSWRRLPRLDISPLRYFPDRTFPRPKRIFKFLHFLAKLFVKANGLDFPLIFSWFTIWTINFIYQQFIYKRFYLLNIAYQCSAIIFFQECKNVH